MKKTFNETEAEYLETRARIDELEQQLKIIDKLSDEILDWYNNLKNRIKELEKPKLVILEELEEK